LLQGFRPAGAYPNEGDAPGRWGQSSRGNLANGSEVLLLPEGRLGQRLDGAQLLGLPEFLLRCFLGRHVVSPLSTSPVRLDPGIATETINCSLRPGDVSGRLPGAVVRTNPPRESRSAVPTVSLLLLQPHNGLKLLAFRSFLPPGYFVAVASQPVEPHARSDHAPGAHGESGAALADRSFLLLVLNVSRQGLDRSQLRTLPELLGGFRFRLRSHRLFLSLVDSY